MRVGIIDADLLTRKNHRFPNLCCMKISSWHKSIGDSTELLFSYDLIYNYDLVYVAKVFTDTLIPDLVYDKENVIIGGTGFFFDKASPLPTYIENIIPDYVLYDDWLKQTKYKNSEYYTDFSIGFTTRGCFRKCPFCINKNSEKVYRHSKVQDFVDLNRPHICLLDDNILGYSNWQEVFEELHACNKTFQFKQGMDMRLMTRSKAEIISKSKYLGDYIFAFDNFKDAEIMKDKLMIWREFNKKSTKFYVLCGFESQDQWDVIRTFERIKLLMGYQCLPYLMRHSNYTESPVYGLYVTLARWCNQPSLFKKLSFREFCIKDSLTAVDPENWSSRRYMTKFEKDYPEIAKAYFDLKYTEATC